MQYIWMIVKGMIIGITNVIPGVSGGTMAVSFGIYDDIIHAVTHVKNEFKQSSKVLGPLAIGALIGIAGFSYFIELLLDQYTLATAIAFIGLILGGLPILWNSFQKSKLQEKQSLNFIHVILFLIFFGIVAWMSFADKGGNGAQSISLSLGNVLALFIVGVASAAAMVVPGVSGSLLMLILGFYYAVIYTINQFTGALSSFDMDTLIPFGTLLAAYAVGMLVGIVLISKAIDYFFQNKPTYTYASILGLVVASPIAILTNTTALADLQSGRSIWYYLLSIIIGMLCFALTFALGRTEDTADAIED
ncbi:DUF368 domain-containing protein [Marinilactibacillus psychrotolerans]|uniref:DUF368 domain-containing protein n=2 Tax=Marinilactibacillus psychrotolerans TaxID=191770 RepID=A0AAV3X096_9LACT|nr:DUF368 domain-containing protein [Marinilactibacillus psychrotolerans]SDD10540.1 putative membrane protein [Marinilactibacillus psychrotolerans]SJN18751.1 membrane protein [Marinilactibacillus psychrotolerans 42ea]GEL67872.1 DUF368 domain-containing protein [Marinilactibacillus psychrotolerans]GEQ34139.1 membrane protein [Marinilactibacillus psychrotolerans]GEQ36614.1 membrane protein [Marinilactibacillus psychrotolerans]